MAEAKSENLLSIQLLRGVAAFLVLSCHAIANNLPADNFVKIIADKGWMGVEIFFIISGFIIPYSMYSNNYKVADFGKFFLKRIARIEPPYIISIALMLFLLYINTTSGKYAGPPFKIDWANTLGHLGYINAITGSPWLNVAYWTLAIEFEYYLILALLFPLIVNQNKLILFSTYFIMLSTAFITLPGNGRHILFYLPFFLLGISLFLFKTKKISLPEFFMLSIPAAAAVYILNDVLLLVISIAVLLIIEFVKKVPKAFLWLGTISYSLYLTHGMIITRFLAVLKKIAPNINIGVALVLDFMVCILLAYLYYMIIEKPAIRLSRKIKYIHSS